MSALASKSNKRAAVYWELEKASKAVQAAGDRLVNAGEALKALGKALEHVKRAGEMARATTFDWQEKGKRQVKTKRDALPGQIRRKIARQGDRIEAIMAEVKAIPVISGRAVKPRKRQKHG